MKAYRITDPAKLKELVPLMKWQKEKDKAAAFARVWSAQSRSEPEKAAKLGARIEIGRYAQLFKLIGDNVSLIGTIRLTQAREFVKGLDTAED